MLLTADVEVENMTMLWAVHGLFLGQLLFAHTNKNSSRAVNGNGCCFVEGIFLFLGRDFRDDTSQGWGCCQRVMPPGVLALLIGGQLSSQTKCGLLCKVLLTQRTAGGYSRVPQVQFIGAGSVADPTLRRNSLPTKLLRASSAWYIQNTYWPKSCARTRGHTWVTIQYYPGSFTQCDYLWCWIHSVFCTIF